MKKILPLLFCFCLLNMDTQAQNTTKNAMEKNKAFTGAQPSKKQYQAIYQLDTNDPAIIEKCIRNINNALTDSRLKDRLQIELIAFSGGTTALLQGSRYQDALKALVQKGVIVAQCHNSLIEKNIPESQLLHFVAIVPSGNGELILRHAQGWAIIKP